MPIDTTPIKTGARKVWKTIKILMLILLLGVIAFGFFAVYGNYSDGYRTGTVYKVSKKGYVFKTYEGQLNLGIIPSAGGIPTTGIWDFSVRDPKVVKALNDATDHKKQVKLYYKEKYYQFDIFGDTKYFVYKVEELNN